jgi:hypothetical protein
MLYLPLVMGGFKKFRFFSQGFLWGLVFVIISPFAFADGSTPTLYGSLGSDSPSSPQSSTNMFSVTAEQINYGTPGSLSAQNSAYLDFTPSFRYLKKFGGSSDDPHSVIGGEGTAILPGSAGVALQWAVPELYYQYARPKSVTVTVGRKRDDWSILDEQFHLGLWQPLARWDALRPISQGLTGAFVEWHPGELENVRIVGFGSTIFLPDQGPEFNISNGQINSSNRWFRPVVDEIDEMSSQSNINYSLDMPTLSNVINHNSVAVMADVGASQGAFAKASYGRMPMNQFLLAGLPSQPTGSNTVNLTIIPMVVDHSLTTVEGGYRYDHGQFVISDTWEHIDNPNLPSNYQQTQLVDSQYIGVVATNDLSVLGVHRANMSLGYVQCVEATSNSNDTIVQGTIESSSQRLTFERLVSWSFEKNIFKTYANSLDTTFGYYYSIDDEGEWLHASVAFKYEKQWTWSLAGDLLGASGALDQNASFISKYRGNDRLIGGLTYVF